MYKHIDGLISAPFMPFKDDGQVNRSVIGDYYKLLSNNGVSGIFIAGTTSEGASLSLDERIDLTEIWENTIIDKNFKLIVHVGHNSVKEAAKLASHAQDIGA